MSRPGAGRAMLAFASVLVVATLVAAVWVMDSPTVQRDLRLDQRRIAQLTQVQVLVEDWARSRGRLPASLAELAAQPGIALATGDPASGKPYGYAVLSAREYRLCATFATDTANADAAAYPYAGNPVEWAHPAGPHCFKRSLPREDAPPDKPAPPAPLPG